MLTLVPYLLCSLVFFVVVVKLLDYLGELKNWNLTHRLVTFLCLVVIYLGITLGIILYAQ